MSKEIIGVIPPIITPIDENEKVDEAGLRKLINHCIDHGIHGIFICGSNGIRLRLSRTPLPHRPPNLCGAKLIVSMPEKLTGMRPMACVASTCRRQFG